MIKAGKFLNDSFTAKYKDSYPQFYDNRQIMPVEFVIHVMEQYGMQVLSDYTDFLLENGYCDTDVYCEPPSAIDRFMHSKLKNK